MTQQALARKYRPQTFVDLIGQEPIVKTLQNAIEQSRIHHAYIFTGTRGVGKTSAARIFAKALNCIEGPTPNPCDTCSNCREIATGNSIDVMEIDAASHTKVEETREIMSRVAYAPAGGSYRIFIIDEVHMLSKSSFNALLKTLEEPPAHVVFILATTEPQKILETVRSRCIEFAFRRITVGNIASYLERVLNQESIDFTPEAVQRISIEADGSMRDALSLTDQVIGFAEHGLTKESVESALGLTSKDVVASLWAGIFCRDAALVHQSFTECYRSGSDLRRLGIDMADFLRQCIVVRATDQESDGLLQDVVKHSAGWSLSDLHRMFDRLHQALLEIERSPIPDIVMETALLRLAVFEPLGTFEQLVSNLPPGSGAMSGEPASSSGSKPEPPVSRAQSKNVEHAPEVAQPNRPGDVGLVDAIAKKHPSIGDTLQKNACLSGDTLQVTLGATELLIKSLLEQDQGAIVETMRSLGIGQPKIEIKMAAKSEPKIESTAPLQRSKRDLLEDDRLRSLLSAFPGAEVMDVRRVQ